MNKIRILVSEIVKDIKEKMPDRRLMAKYSLTPRSLSAVKKTLLENKFISSSQLRAQKQNQPGTKRTVNAREFVNDFRNNSDDRYLMGKYCLKPDQLRAVYRKLVENEHLFEWEINERRGRAMQLESAQSTTLSSAAVSVVETGSVRDGDASTDEDRLPKEFFKDFSGVRIGKEVIEVTPDFDQLPDEDSPPAKEIPPKDPAHTVGVLKWGSRQGTRAPKKSHE